LSHDDIITRVHRKIPRWVIQGRFAVDDIHFAVGPYDSDFPLIREIGEVACGLDRLGNGDPADENLATGLPNLPPNVKKPIGCPDRDVDGLVDVGHVLLLKFALKFSNGFAGGYNGFPQVWRTDGAILPNAATVRNRSRAQAAESDGDLISGLKAVRGVYVEGHINRPGDRIHGLWTRCLATGDHQHSRNQYTSANKFH
jgi:hypothetical protein